MTSVVEPNRMHPGNGRFRAQFWKTELCRFWRSGCRNGKLCPFAHGEDELMNRPDLAKTSLCQRWAKGACPLEAQECRFAHGHLDLRATPNFMQGGQAEQGVNSQMVHEPGCVETEVRVPALQEPTNYSILHSLRLPGDHGAEAPILSTVTSGPAPGNQRGGQPPPPRLWEEDFSNPHAAFAAAGPPADVLPWGGRNNGNQWNEDQLDQMQAVLAQRSDWQWSPEYGDAVTLGLVGEDARNGNRRGGRRRAAKPAGMPGMPAGIGMDPAVPSNGRPPPPPPPLQQMLPLNGQTMPATGLLSTNGGEIRGGPHAFPECEPSWPQVRANSVHSGGTGWIEAPAPPHPLATAAPYPETQYGPTPQPEVQQVSQGFPHAITASDTNIMHPTVPQELRAIWG